MSNILTAWISGFMVSGLLWMVAFVAQRSLRLAPDAAPIPKWLAWISGYPGTPTVEPGSYGFQFYAVSLLIVNTVLVLVVPPGDRIAWYSLALIVNLLIAWLVVEWLRRRRVAGR